MEREGLDPADAVREVAAAAVFTTHTPVEAGHDRFKPDLAGQHLEALAAGLHMPLEAVLALGSEQPDDPGSPFCPTVLALRLSRRANGVSALHGRISRRMWHHLYAGRPEEEVPIGHITNGVHVRTWLAADMHALLVHYLGPQWLESIGLPDLWAEVERIAGRRNLGDSPDSEGAALRVRAAAAGRAPPRGSDCPIPPREPLLPDALTFGFARRFATYKRADILFHDLERLDRLVNNADRPLQIVFAGKAHPRGHRGKGARSQTRRPSSTATRASPAASCSSRTTTCTSAASSCRGWTSG